MLFERPGGGEKAVLVHVDFGNELEREDPEEFVQLVTSAGGDPVCFIRGQRRQPQPRYFIGKGKLDEIAAAVEEHCADLVLFNHALSPGQERNLEAVLKCRVLDRTGLILDIFALRARTHEGKLQVELAQLEHLSSRLIRGWTHLERQKGGIGMRGPGETQLESDRRMVRDRIKSLHARLDKVRRHRALSRRARTRAELPSVSLVGYTNAGKSTLFNRFTGADAYAADQLFATLDPTLRRVELADIGPAIFADTVGFIRHLPHKLVESFRATLEEAIEADLLVHVIDCASDERSEQRKQVYDVLRDIGADSTPVLEVYNKVDLTGMAPRIDRDDTGKITRVWLSALSGEGLDLLGSALSELLATDLIEKHIRLSPEQGGLRSRFYALSAVTDEQFNDDGSAELTLRLPRADFVREMRRAGLG